MTLPLKKVRMELEGMDGNIFFLMGRFRKMAQRQGWTGQEIGRVLNECRSKDYNYALEVLMTHIETPDSGEPQ